MVSPQIYVGEIAWRAVEALNMQCVLRLLRTPGILYDLKTGDALVDRQRAVVATRFLLETKADVLVTIDSDILFEPDDVLTIAEQAVTHDIVAGLYMTRSAGRCIPTSHLLPDTPISLDDPDPQPIKWAASGFTAYHRRVFERLTETMPICHEKQPEMRFFPFYTPFPYDDEENGVIYLSEDWALSERARAAGFGVYLNAAVRLSHLGVYPYGRDDLIRQDVPDGSMTVTRLGGPGARYRAELTPAGLKDNPSPFDEPLIPNRAERRRQARELARV